MSSFKAAEANRINAKKSTGPKSEEGKAVVSQNAVKHGLFSKHVVIENESIEEFNVFKEKLLGDLKPDNSLEELFTEKIIIQAWRLRRAIQIESGLMGGFGGAEDVIQSFVWNLEPLTLLTRYEASIEKSLSKSLYELQRLQTARMRAAVPLPVFADLNGGSFDREG